MYKRYDIRDHDTFDMLYKNWAYTVIGAGGNLNEWMSGINKLLAENNIGKVNQFYVFKGKDMNEKYKLSGDVAYPDDLTFIAFTTENLNVAKLSIFRLRMQDHWFTDIVDNNETWMEQYRQRLN